MGPVSKKKSLLLCLGDPPEALAEARSWLSGEATEWLAEAELQSLTQERACLLEVGFLFAPAAQVELWATRIREVAPRLALVASCPPSAALEELEVLCAPEADQLKIAAKLAISSVTRRQNEQQLAARSGLSWLERDRHGRLVSGSPGFAEMGLATDRGLPDGARLKLDDGRVVRVTRLDSPAAGAASSVAHLDVTALDACEQRLLDRSRAEAVGELARGVVHDLNNAFCVIASFADLLLESIEDEDERREDVLEIARAGARASTLTGRLVAFSRARPHSLGPIDLVESVGAMEPMFERALGGTFRVSLEMHCSSAITLCNRSDLEQVLVAMVLRARRFAQKGSLISVAIEAGEGWAEITARPLSVATQPPPEETEERRMEEVHLAVGRMGGRVEVDQSSMVVAVPRIDLDLAQDTVPRSRTSHGRLESVLIVEDESSLRQAMSRVLSALGYMVREVRRAEDAAPFLPTTDLMIVDYALPEQNGLELIRSTRQSGPKPRALLVTGYADAEIGDPSGVPVLRKPFTAAELAREVRRQLDQDLDPS